MQNNDVLKKIRYIFDYGDDKMMKIFSFVEVQVTREVLSNWLKKDDDSEFKGLRDIDLAHFLNGFIIEKRGKQEGVTPIAEKVLTNNIILRKIMIALTLKSEDVISILELADFFMTKTELSAFFRKKGHKHYRELKDQILRNFLMGLQLKYRETKK